MAILAWFKYFQKIPIVGRWIFNLMVSYASPYTGTLSLSVDSLSAGQCTATMREWWLLRNPFKSIHAAALLNLGEFTGGIALLVWTEEVGCRAIVNRLSIDYYKKARGKITAKTKVDLLKMPKEGTTIVITELYDEQGTLVAKTEAVWKISQLNKKLN